MPFFVLEELKKLIQGIKMNKLVNKFLLAGNKFMPEMHFWQPGFMYSACGPFMKNNERIQKFKEAGDLQFIYQNKLDKACFQHGMTYGGFKDLTRRAASDKIMPDKALNIAKIQKYGYQRGLSSMVYKFFDEQTLVETDKIENIPNKKLSEELHKQITKFEKTKVHSPFIDNILRMLILQWTINN